MKTPITRPVIARGYDGLTSEGVHCTIVTRQAKLDLSRKEILASLPVSPEVCAHFGQRAAYISDVLAELERDGMHFHVESERGGSTYVWRLA